MQYILHILIMIVIYIMLAQSLNLLAGFSGLISLAHAGFYGIGAYTSALLSINYNFSFIILLPVAMIISGLLALIISIIAMRTADDYFIIITIGIQIIIFSVMNNWFGLTNGPLGINNIPPVKILGYTFVDKIPFLIISLFLAGLIFYILRNISSSPFGNLLKAISEDEILMKSFGKNVYKTKIITFAICAMFAAVPGVLYAHYISYIDPQSFTIHESIFILSIVIIGGMRNLWGSALAAAFLLILPEFLRFVGLPKNLAANMRQIIYGSMLVLMIFRLKNVLYKKNSQILKLFSR